MELGDGAGWSADLAWGLLLIVLNVLFHAISLGLINKDVASRLGWLPAALASCFAFPLCRWRDGALNCHLARHRGFQLGGRLPISRGIAKPAVCNALFDERHDELRPRESLFGSALANDGLARGVERLDSLWSHNRFPVCYSSESVVVA